MSSGRVVRTKDFGLAFQRICNLIAIVESRQPHETLIQLVQQCFVVVPDEPYRSSHDLVEALDALFGIAASPEEVQYCIDQLLTEKSLQRTDSGLLLLGDTRRSELTARVLAAERLEQRVREVWLEEATALAPDCEPAKLWACLRTFLAKAFRRHGLQAARLLDPSINSELGGEQPLSDLLREALSETIPRDLHESAREAISAFLAQVGTQVDRATYVAQLADGAFAYFSLEVDPQAAADFVSRLDTLAVFLDTNFLFGILGLNAGPAVSVADELTTLVSRANLPFKLRYHPRTSRELRSTITHYGDTLASRHWSQALSRSIVATRSGSGLVARYHELNAETPIKPGDFLRPLSEVDSLLRDRGVSLHPVSAGRPTDSGEDLVRKYTDYLEARNRAKLASVIEHDMTLLSFVIGLQAGRPTSYIGQRAILLTFDYNLYCFDQMESQSSNRDPVVVLPNVFMQLIRPLARQRQDFDGAFAQTFALPEFRTIGSGSTEATLRLFSILASVTNIREELAAKILVNQSVRDRLQAGISDDVIVREIELAVAEDNRALAERAKQLEAQAFEERAAKSAAQRAMDQLRDSKDEVIEEKRLRIDELESHAAELERRLLPQPEASDAIAEPATSTTQPDQSPASASAPAAGRAMSRKLPEASPTLYPTLVASLVGVVTALLMQVIPWKWLETHPRHLGLQLGAALFVGLVTLLALEPRHRTWTGVGGLLVALVVAGLTIVER